MKKDFDFSGAKEIEIEVKMTGRYIIHNGMVTVSSFFGQKSAQVGGLPPEHLAQMLLRELASGSEQKGSNIVP